MLSVFSKTITSCKSLFKIMIPVIILIKIIQELNGLSYFSYFFYPIMSILNIPQEYSLAWMGGLLNNNYTTFSLIIMLFQSLPISYEQLTIISFLSLICHSIIVESIIAKQVGVNPFFSALTRFFMAILTAYIFHIVCQEYGYLQDIVNNSILSSQITSTPTLWDYHSANTLSYNYFVWLSDILVWIFEQIKIMVLIFIIIFIIFLSVKLINDYGIFQLINKLTIPFCRLMKIKDRNNFILFICFIVGLSYGWGLLKEESINNNEFSGDQAFKIITFLGISHAMIEDTFIFSLLGASFFILFFLRLFMSILLLFIISNLVLPYLSENFKKKYLY